MAGLLELAVKPVLTPQGAVVVQVFMALIRGL
jgi:hypothetical protein